MANVTITYDEDSEEFIVEMAIRVQGARDSIMGVGDTLAEAIADFDKTNRGRR